MPNIYFARYGISILNISMLRRAAIELSFEGGHFFTLLTRRADDSAAASASLPLFTYRCLYDGYMHFTNKQLFALLSIMLIACTRASLSRHLNGARYAIAHRVFSHSLISFPI